MHILGKMDTTNDTANQERTAKIDRIGNLKPMELGTLH